MILSVLQESLHIVYGRKTKLDDWGLLLGSIRIILLEDCISPLLPEPQHSYSTNNTEYKVGEIAFTHKFNVQQMAKL